MEAVDFISVLPHHIQLFILSYLTPKELPIVPVVSRKWHSIIFPLLPSLWRGTFLHFPLHFN